MAIIVSDPVIRNELRSLIGKCDPECQVMEEAGSIADARPLLANFSPGALLLDADLPDGSGFDLLDSLPSELHQVILLADSPDAVGRASDYHVVDFILKPIEQATLSRALGKLRCNGSSDNALPPSPTAASGLPAEAVEPLDMAPVRRHAHLAAERGYPHQTDDCYPGFFTVNGKHIILPPFPW